MPYNTTPTPFNDSQKKLLYIVYGLYLASILFGGLTAVVGVVLLYVKRNELSDYADHCTYLIRTFWGSFLCYIAGFVLLFVGIGMIVLFAAAVWFFARTIIGGLKLHDDKGVNAESWWI